MKPSVYDEKYKLMTESPVLGLVARMSVPTVITTLITTVYNMSDTFFVSGLGNEATGAVSVVFSIQSIIQAVGYGFGMGSQSLISRLLGEKKREEASLYGTSAFVASFLMGLLIMIIGLCDLPFFMRLFGSTETALEYTISYGRLILIGAPLFCSSFVLNNIMKAQGKPTLSMIGLCSGGIINIGLDALFIFSFNMGVAGAALATIISQTISFLILLCFFISGKSTVSVNPLKTSRKIGDYWKVFRIGMPTVFRQSLGSLATTVLNRTIRPYGDVVMSAVGIANKIYMLLRSMLIGVGQGFMPVAGYNYGAGKKDRVKKAFNAGVIIGTSYCFVAAVALFFFGEQIMGLFRAGDTEVIEIGGTMLRYMSYSMIVLGYSTFVNQLYQCLGFVVPATILASCRQGIFFIPLILTLPGIIGLTGIQITQTVSDLLTFIASVPFHIHILKTSLSEQKTN